MVANKNGNYKPKNEILLTQGKRSQMFVAGQKKSKRFKTAKELGLEL